MIRSLFVSLLLFNQDPVYQTTTKLIEVSVVATDAKGQMVKDLTKDDFTLLEDGKRQTVSHFFTEATMRQGGAPPKLPKGIYTNRPELLPHAPRTVNAIVIDYLNTPWVAQTATREQLLKLLRTTGPDDVVALYTLGPSLRILHDFTGEREVLMNRLQKSPGLLSATKSERDLIRASAMRWERSFDEPRSLAEAVFETSQQRARTTLTIESLNLIARHMAGIPGRKNLIWMSTGFPISILPVNSASTTNLLPDRAGGRGIFQEHPGPLLGGANASLFLDELDRSIQLINDSGVSVYGVDVAGLTVPMAAGEEGWTSALTNASLSHYSAQPDSQTALAELSARTGGVPTLNSNDIDGALRRAFDDSHDAYSMAYSSTNHKSDGKFRKIEIKVNRPGVKLRYRQGYTADDPGQKNTARAKADLDEAAASPVSQTAVLLSAQMSPSVKGYDMVLQIEPRQVAFQQTKQGRTASLDLMFFQRTDKQKMNGTHSLLPITLTDEQYGQVMQKGLLYRRSFEKEAGAYEMRVVVRDAVSGATGTLDIPLQ